VHERIEDAVATATEIRTPAVFGRGIRGFDRADAAEAFVGSVVFGLPMLIEEGTLEVGRFIATLPVYYAGTLLLGFAIVYGLLYVADLQRVEVVKPLFGVIPRRFAGVLVISFTTSLVLMTAWGRIDWAEPTVAFAQVSFVFVGMALGATLGDLLPGT
jgi:uncharacterized membrane protein